MMNSSHSIPNLLQDLLKKLEFIAMIQKNKKPNISTMDMVDSGSLYGAWVRFRLGENKQNLMMHLDQIIQQTIQAIHDYQQTEYVPIIVHTLANAKVGFLNLLSTYSSSPNTVAQLKVFLTNIDLQLEKNKHLIQMQTVPKALVAVQEKPKGMILSAPPEKSNETNKNK